MLRMDRNGVLRRSSWQRSRGMESELFLLITFFRHAGGLTLHPYTAWYVLRNNQVDAKQLNLLAAEGMTARVSLGTRVLFGRCIFLS